MATSTGGIIDMQTKSGLFAPGGQVGVYGGSHGTITPSFDYGGSSGGFNYFVSGDYTTDTLGIESPDGSIDPQHDRTKQYHGFAFAAGHAGPEFQHHRDPGHLQRHVPDPQPGRACSPAASTALSGLGPQDPGSGDYLLQANGQSGVPVDDAR